MPSVVKIPQRGRAMAIASRLEDGKDEPRRGAAYGTTAVASISTRALGSYSSFTPTTAIAG